MPNKRKNAVSQEKTPERDAAVADTDRATGNGHVDSPDVSASGDEETIDGLNERDEAVRASVEDLPGGTRKRAAVPVFDRGEAEE